MGKGAFYPELLQMNLYVQNPREIQAFLQQWKDELFTPAVEAAECGLPPPDITFCPSDYSLDQVTAIGSFVHEFVHFLQYTTRKLGFLFYECRFQQFLWTKTCLRELAADGHALRLPLMRWFEEAGADAPGALARWRDRWAEYQAAVSVSGMGPTLEWDDGFGSYVRSEMSREWFPTLTLKEPDGSTLAVELSTGRMMETEADVIVITLLQELFPEMSGEACDELLGPPDPIRRSIAIPLMYAGLTHVVPIIADYCMQLPLNLTGKPKSASGVFCDMLAVVTDRFAGMSRRDVFAHGKEVIRTLSSELGIMPLEESIHQTLSATEKANISRTGLGKALVNAIRFRLDNPLSFALPTAFIFLNFWRLPLPTWVAYNYGVLDEWQSRMETTWGVWAEDREGFDVSFLRLLLWGCREIAIRPGRYVCPHCNLNARWATCSGDCGFVTVCRENLGVDIAKANYGL